MFNWQLSYSSFYQIVHVISYSYLQEEIRNITLLRHCIHCFSCSARHFISYHEKCLQCRCSKLAVTMTYVTKVRQFMPKIVKVVFSFTVLLSFTMYGHPHKLQVETIDGKNSKSIYFFVLQCCIHSPRIATHTDYKYKTQIGSPLCLYYR